MTLLFDQNVSPKLVERLADSFPGSSHVQEAGLERANDMEVWAYARQNGCTIVTKDEDFSEISVLRGCPPKVVWLQLGNCTTSHLESTLRSGRSDIMEFESNRDVGTLVLGQVAG